MKRDASIQVYRLIRMINHRDKSVSAEKWLEMLKEQAFVVLEVASDQRSERDLQDRMCAR